LDRDFDILDIDDLIFRDPSFWRGILRRTGGAEAGKHEGGESEGLGLVPGQVIKMEPGKGERLPHVGWNDVAIEKPSVLFQSIPTGTDFYFVHSFHLATTDGDDQVASAPCCGRIAAAVERGRVFGVQFHPEKSSKAGFQLIRNFLGVV
jgi:glutamine amidotransferase